MPGERPRGEYYIILYQGWQDCQRAYINGKTPIACAGAGFPLAGAPELWGEMQTPGQCRHPHGSGLSLHLLTVNSDQHKEGTSSGARCVTSGPSPQDQALADQHVSITYTVF